MAYNADKPTSPNITRLAALITPNIVLTKSKLKNPINPQLTPPTTRTPKAIQSKTVKFFIYIYLFC